MILQYSSAGEVFLFVIVQQCRLGECNGYVHIITEMNECFAEGTEVTCVTPAPSNRGPV